MIVPEVVERQENLVVTIERQKRLKQVLLVPQSLPIQYPIARVVSRGEYVMDVHQHARSQLGKKLQILKKDVALWSDRVRRIDNKDVVLR